jgi:hypothetical protein
MRASSRPLRRLGSGVDIVILARLACERQRGPDHRPSAPLPKGNRTVDLLTLLGLFGLALIVAGGIAASLLAKRTDELLHGKGPHHGH